MAGVCKRVPKMGNSHKLHSPTDYDDGELRSRHADLPR
ncbi:hypothetical protein Tam10B_2131 [Bifidobacterium vansinderenii]|uniref:Uncharacterized protein n=1 Tax=Bifidobacterium vansinderenii TaxID=1984871 RepID=A0A229VVI9_9BIFI|nr:hypothetical protein Tam10B_2131 [Bifidobacterium vansinderenii]